jgi:hypothetical protein
MRQKFDAIVFGDDPAGCDCAYRLAQSGLEVLVVERGKFCRAKNTCGGAFFGRALNDLIPDFWKEVPIERYVARQRLSMLGEESCLSLEFTTPEFSNPPYNAFITLRSRFDRWMAISLEIGQTSHIVSPDLYIAIGISGAPQHMAGCSNSRCIVAINKNPEANIYEVSDFGLVGDYRQALPPFIDKCRELLK